MELTAYNSEKFKRWKIWYIIFISVLTTVVVLSIFTKNTVWVIVLFWLLWAYFYYSVMNNRLIKILIQKWWLTIGTKTYPRNAFVWYVIEINAKTQEVKNIVFVSPKWYFIHTIHDEIENIKNFMIWLNDYLPMLKDFDQNTLEKLTRRFQL